MKDIRLNKDIQMNMDYPFGRSARPKAPTLPAYRRRLFAADLRQACLNLKAIVRREPPKIVQLGNGLWAMLWGLNMAARAPAIFAASPRLYAWMHVGALQVIPARGWGLAAFVLGLMQLHALSWPTGNHPLRCIRAARLICSFWAGMLTGFLYSGVPNNANVFYFFLTALSIWTLWRLSGNDTSNADNNTPNG